MPEMSGIPQLRKSTKLSNHGEDRTSVPTKEASVFDRFSYQSVPMGSATHEWLVKSAAGLWGRVHSLLLQDPQLALTKDFISGFTALHWAAKAGNTQMVRNILDISRFRGTELDVDSRTHSGYTPLHVAAIHGRDAVIAMLVRDYRASVNLRDNDGKKPYHYLEKGMSCELGELLGDPHMTKPGGCQDMAERGEYREHPRRLNALSELIGHRRRYRQHTDEDAAERRDVPQTYHRRHLSNMFHLN
ncbi:hypothetical protein DPEC_G00021970 [Dallia pectoralis]|uniref:Uncharacterized protein n=1 Tax=Dallia pectoralis TaxID=75939 RepID=A0ACC2HH17_DALPE|nr:hypothetical protein DPEC_G00021970 [Dallia pectoralis]